LVFPALERVGAGKPTPTLHGEPPQWRLTTGSCQQPVNRQQIYTRSPCPLCCPGPHRHG